jgi:hypothetical protein
MVGQTPGLQALKLISSVAHYMCLTFEGPLDCGQRMGAETCQLQVLL